MKKLIITESQYKRLLSKIVAKKNLKGTAIIKEEGEENEATSSITGDKNEITLEFNQTFASGQWDLKSVNIPKFDIEAKKLADFITARKDSAIVISVLAGESRVTNPIGPDGKVMPVGELAKRRTQTAVDLLNDFLKKNNIATDKIKFEAPTKPLIGATPYKAGVDKANDPKYTKEQFLKITAKVVAGTDDLNKLQNKPASVPGIPIDNLIPDQFAVNKEINLELFFVQETPKFLDPADADSKMNKVLEFMKFYPKSAVKIDGHVSDELTRHDKAPDKIKLENDLSLKRAIAVKDYLVKNGIEANRILTAGFGSTKPVDNKATKEAQAKNRRIILIVLKKA